MISARAPWWASECSRTSNVAWVIPKAATERIVLSSNPVAINSPRCAKSESRISVKSAKSSAVSL